MLIRNELSRCLKDKSIAFSYDVYEKVEESVRKAGKALDKNVESSEIKRISEALLAIMDDTQFVIQRFESETEFSSLKKITRVVDKPILLLIYSGDNFIQGRCSVPEVRCIYELQLQLIDLVSHILSFPNF